jgi:hypothetical protein
LSYTKPTFKKAFGIEFIPTDAAIWMLELGSRPTDFPSMVSLLRLVADVSAEPNTRPGKLTNRLIQKTDLSVVRADWFC